MSKPIIDMFEENGKKIMAVNFHAGQRRNFASGEMIHNGKKLKEYKVDRVEITPNSKTMEVESFDFPELHVELVIKKNDMDTLAEIGMTHMHVETLQIEPKVNSVYMHYSAVKNTFLASAPEFLEMVSVDTKNKWGGNARNRGVEAIIYMPEEQGFYTKEKLFDSNVAVKKYPALAVV